MEQVPCEFQADWPNFIFQPAAPDVIWHIYSIQCCFKGVLGMDLPSSGDVAVTMGWGAPWVGDGAIHLPSSGEVLLGLGKVSCESVEDHTKHWGSYP